MTSKPVSPTPVELLKAKKTPDLVTVPARMAIALRGAGSPDAPDFAEAVGALYGIAYTMRFARKKTGLPVFKVGTLEGEWWAEGEDLPTDRIPDRDTWRWEVRIAMPDDATVEEVADAIEAATTKKKGKLFGSEVARSVKLVELPETRIARLLHLGPYSEEPASFERIDVMLEEEGLRREHRHTEIYLSDPSRTAPEKLKTVLVVSVEAKG